MVIWDMLASQGVYLDILELYALQQHAIDNGDCVPWAETFTMSGSFISPSYSNSPFVGREQLIEFASAFHNKAVEAGLQYRHIVTGVSVAVYEPKIVSARSYLLLVCSNASGVCEIIRSAVLDDSLVLTEKGWRVDRRTVFPDGLVSGRNGQLCV